MIRIKVTSGSRRKVFYVRDDFINAPKPDRTQMKKEAEEFIEYIRTEHKKVEAEVPNKTTATWEDEALEEVLSKLRAIPDSYEGFVLGIYTYVRKKPERLERVMNYINNNMDVTSSDVVEYVLQQPDFHEDGVNPIQISVYEDKIYIWNDGEMPPNLNSTDKLFMKHSSKPYNPKLANIFFKSGMIEAWGRGFEKIKEACELYDGPLPEYEINESGIMVLCKACNRYLELLRNDGQHHDQNGHDMVMMILDFCKDAKSVPEIMEAFGFESRTSFRRKYLNDLVETGKLKMTMPDKPKSKNQKYYS